MEEAKPEVRPAPSPKDPALARLSDADWEAIREYYLTDPEVKEWLEADLGFHEYDETE